MTGDVVNIYGKSFWHNNTGSNPSNTYLISSLLNSFIGAFAGTPAVGTVHGATASALQGSTPTTGGVTSWLQSVPNPSTTTVPKAYINWILFNEQFVPVAANCGFDGVSTVADAVKAHNPTVSIGTSGFLYVYCSNESNVDVFFDNLQLIHTRGPLLETTNYYPYGLTMAGISDRAAKMGYAENKYLYNKGSELQNKEFSDGSGLEMYDTHFRNLDPQLGRWWQIDPKPNESLTLYGSMDDDPIIHNDPLGDCPICFVIAAEALEAGAEFAEIAYNSYRGVKTIQTVSSVVSAVTGADQKGQTTDMVITTDASGKTIAIPATDHFMKQLNSWMEQSPSILRSEGAKSIEKEITQLDKSNRTLEKRVNEHEQKLSDYKKDLDKSDNKNILKNATPGQRQGIINNRLKRLEREIQKFKNNIQKNNDKINNLNKKKEEIPKS